MRWPASGFRLGTLIDGYWRWCRWRRHLRHCLSCGFATQAESLCERRSLRRISRGDEQVIAPQSPSAQVFIPIESVLSADVPPKRLGPIATLEAHHVILMN